MTDHGANEIFDIVRLNAVFGKELGWAQTELLHFRFGKVSPGIDN